MKNITIKRDYKTKPYHPGQCVTGYIEGTIPENPNVTCVALTGTIMIKSLFGKPYTVWTQTQYPLKPAKMSHLSAQSFSVPFSIEIPQEQIATFTSIKPPLNCTFKIIASLNILSDIKYESTEEEISIVPNSPPFSLTSSSITESIEMPFNVTEGFCCFAHQTSNPTTVTVAKVPTILSTKKNYSFDINFLSSTSETNQIRPSHCTVKVSLHGRYKNCTFSVSEVKSTQFFQLPNGRLKRTVALPLESKKIMLIGRYPPSTLQVVTYSLRVKIINENAMFCKETGLIEVPVEFYPLENN